MTSTNNTISYSRLLVVNFIWNVLWLMTLKGPRKYVLYVLFWNWFLTAIHIFIAMNEWIFIDFVDSEDLDSTFLCIQLQCCKFWKLPVGVRVTAMKYWLTERLLAKYRSCISSINSQCSFTKAFYNNLLPTKYCTESCHCNCFKLHF